MAGPWKVHDAPLTVYGLSWTFHGPAMDPLLALHGGSIEGVKADSSGAMADRREVDRSP